MKSRSVTGRLANVFGFDPASLERYPLQWWMVLIIAAVVAKIAQALASDMIGQFSLLVLPFAWVVLSRTLFSFFEKRYQDKLLHQFPDALAMIVRAVRVGIPLRRGHPHRGARGRRRRPATISRLLYDRVSIGMTLEDALREMARRSKLPEYRFFTTALCAAKPDRRRLERGAGGARRRDAPPPRAESRAAMALAAEANTTRSHPRLAAVRLRRLARGAEPGLYRPAVHTPGLRDNLRAAP